MGEYLTINNQEVKIGTCESMYYARLSDLQALLSTVPDVEVYLQESNGFRYRFPFPEEDGADIGYDDFPYNKGLSVNLSDEFAPKLIECLKSKDWEHTTICHHIKAISDNRYGFNVFHPCPLDPEFNLERSVGETQNVVQIVQQKQVDGEVWTVIRCAYCGSMIRLNWEDALELINQIEADVDRLNDIKQDSQAAYWHEIACRIANGYPKHIYQKQSA